MLTTVESSPNEFEALLQVMQEGFTMMGSGATLRDGGDLPVAGERARKAFGTVRPVPREESAL